MPDEVMHDAPRWREKQHPRLEAIASWLARGLEYGATGLMFVLLPIGPFVVSAIARDASYARRYKTTVIRGAVHARGMLRDRAISRYLLRRRRSAGAPPKERIVGACTHCGNCCLNRSCLPRVRQWWAFPLPHLREPLLGAAELLSLPGEPQRHRVVPMCELYRPACVGCPAAPCHPGVASGCPHRRGRAGRPLKRRCLTVRRSAYARPPASGRRRERSAGSESRGCAGVALSPVRAARRTASRYSGPRRRRFPAPCCIPGGR